MNRLQQFERDLGHKPVICCRQFLPIEGEPQMETQTCIFECSSTKGLDRVEKKLCGSNKPAPPGIRGGGAVMRQIFISSVQKELQEFRFAIGNYVKGDPLLSQFFTVFLFEDLPAADRRADNHGIHDWPNQCTTSGTFDALIVSGWKRWG